MPSTKYGILGKITDSETTGVWGPCLLYFLIKEWPELFCFIWDWQLFDFTFQESEKIHFMTFGTGGHKKQFVLSWDTPKYFKKQQTTKPCPKCMLFRNLGILKNGKLWKRRVPKDPWGPTYIFSKTLRAISLSFNKHDMEILELFISVTGTWTLEFLFQSRETLPPHSDFPPCISPPLGGHVQVEGSAIICD